ncbi:hypothetical protein CAPTEDRAFT_201842 [Capitella teleta]|uniref:Uncharacterized protein n=1 Tax=Capitella teleta TaxID=283909 RepID=R7UA86_CAPTE|nr:hypothetical protein CAPTEDRAFT_201842 [Capitella teleta]|eukprot:ELU03021.1 hypothetical protein CAPTEDRAFT_201842 [Capitella teleta]
MDDRYYVHTHASKWLVNNRAQHLRRGPHAVVAFCNRNQLMGFKDVMHMGIKDVMHGEINRELKNVALLHESVGHGDQNINRPTWPNRLPCLTRLQCHASETVIEGKNITVDLFNARSISNKSEMLRERIVDKAIDILALTETGQREGDDATEIEICPPGYKFIGIPMFSCMRGGGVGFVVAPDSVADKSPTTNNFRTFELLTIKVKAKQPLYLFLIYRPPPTLNNTHFGENHTFASKKLRKSQFSLSYQYDRHNTHCDYRGYVV